MATIAKNILFSPAGYARFVMLLAGLISALGFVISFWTSEAHWAARFGALVVVLGVWGLYFFHQHFGGIDDNDEIWKLKRNVKIGVAAAFSHDEKSQKVRDSFRLKSSFLRIEVCVLTLGTLQWGFGDLAASALFLVENETC